MRARSDTAWIEERAKALGFELCGVARASKFPELAHTEEWLARGYAGEMKYLSDARRSNPDGAMPGIRSVIVCALHYNTAQPKSTDVAQESDAAEPRGWISRYAWGGDYHDVLRKKLDGLVAALREKVEEPFEARVYADTGPLQERVFAKYAGLGWVGKNTLLLNQALGSWFFLGAILTTLDLTQTLGPAEMPAPDLCGSCRRCIDACPTKALVAPYVLDARRCISYLTIELRGRVPEELREPMGHHVFGCDICQDVCPWNGRAPVTREEDFGPRIFPLRKNNPANAGESPGENSLFLPKLEWLASMDEAEYREVFRGSPMLNHHAALNFENPQRLLDNAITGI
ncbi:MAG TPA: tRNA epoxyqueuosine(34) reductase QueG [Candidatus Sulfotelmatobacter sp.]